MDSYYDYLAVQVLNEKQIVSYRSVSRALKVHVNLAKQMLWDFHHRENARQQGTVHATYLVMGQRKTGNTVSARSSQRRDGDDVVMDSSPPLPGSSMPMSASEPDTQPVNQKAMLLVKQEDLGAAKSTFEHITSIHVYSIEAKGLEDFQLLTECTRQVLTTLRTDDLLATGKQYGLIQNPNAKRRTRKTPLQIAAVAKPAPATAKKEPESGTAATKPAAKATLPPKPTLKKQGSSGIAASFAKGASKPKPVAKAEAVKPAADTDLAMGGMSDDDDDDQYGDLHDGVEEIDVKAPGGKSKKDRQAELEAMMDVEDEPIEEPDEPSAPIEEAPAPVKEEPKESVVVENGRRRGRRRVMKKKTVRDEEGYLVTKEEAVWESFSEDEPVPKKAKLSAAAAPPAAKKAGKPGQGNIMSFFSKK